MTTFQLNVSTAADAQTPLLWVLRDHLGLTGTKYGCGIAVCGACTVHLDGQPVRSCQTTLAGVQGKRVTTIEGVGATAQGKALQAAWVAQGVAQCGFCQAGQIMSACAVLKAHPKPTEQQIDEGLSGNICRCGTYTRIRDAIKQAAGTGHTGGAA
jgi:isoquinoline 1-oxidoreductase alpha subunit